LVVPGQWAGVLVRVMNVAGGFAIRDVAER
jgi:hypothetical protein